MTIQDKLCVNQRIVTFTAKEQAELLDHPDTVIELKPDEIFGKTICSLISPGTEINHAYLGEDFPTVSGYAAVFDIEAVGSEVTDLAPGDRVVCTGPHGIGGHRAYQQCPRIAAVKVPASLEPAAAAHARLMIVTMAALTATIARPPMAVLIMGMGPIGNLAAQLFSSCGYEVYGVEPNETRRAFAQSKGLNIFETAPLDDKALHARTVAAIDCSGHEQAVVDACQCVRPHGEIFLTGVPWRKRSDVSAHDVFHAVYRGFLNLRSGWEWQIPRHPEKGRHGSVFQNLAGAVKWLDEGRVDVEGMYSTESPENAQQVYQDLLHQKTATPTVLFDWTE